MESETLDYLVGLGENDFLDYKRQYPSVNSDLVHDILCLSNSLADSDRYLIFGVDDNKTIYGIGSDTNRRKLADIITVLRSARLNRIPKLSLLTFTKEDHEIDVLIVKDVSEKPYFLTEDYTQGGRPLRAGVVYSRISDSNTPVNGTSPDHAIEKMYYERFGLKLSPKARLLKYLKESHKWHYGYNELGNLYFYHEDFPEFTIMEKDKDHSDSYVEPWSIDFSDKNSTKDEYFIKYHGTILDSLILIWLDGARNKRIQPRHKIINQNGNYYHYYYYVKDSLDHLANEMILKAYPDLEIHRGLDHLFPVFESVEEADQILGDDFVKPVNEYIWYFFDKSQDDYIKVEAGKKWRIFWKR